MHPADFSCNFYLFCCTNFDKLFMPWATATMIDSWPTLSEVSGINLKFKERKELSSCRTPAQDFSSGTGVRQVLTGSPPCRRSVSTSGSQTQRYLFSLTNWVVGFQLSWYWRQLAWYLFFGILSYIESWYIGHSRLWVKLIFWTTDKIIIKCYWKNKPYMT